MYKLVNVNWLFLIIAAAYPVGLLIGVLVG